LGAPWGGVKELGPAAPFSLCVEMLQREEEKKKGKRRKERERRRKKKRKKCINFFKTRNFWGEKQNTIYGIGIKVIFGKERNRSNHN
jgi:hypothetical protein